jgi:hypothetical protein
MKKANVKTSFKNFLRLNFLRGSGRIKPIEDERRKDGREKN